MRSFLVFAGLALALTSPAFADNADATRNWPPLVRQALGTAHEGHEDDIWRFTMTADYGDAGRFSARFDSTRPEGERWTLVSPASAEAMSEALRDHWIDLSTPDEDEDAGDSESADEEDSGTSFGIGGGGSGLFFSAETAEMIGGDLAQLRRSGGRAAYTFQPRMSDDEDGGDADDFGRFLSGELTVTESDPFVERLRIHAPASFKPHPAARVHSFEMVMEFARVEGLPGPILQSFATDVDVSALFQRQTQAFRFTFSDVEYEAR